MILRSLLLFCLCCILQSNSQAQKIEVLGGIIIQNLGDGYTTNSDRVSNLNIDNGYSFGIALDNPNANGIASRISVLYNSYSGSVVTSYTFEGFTSSTEASFNKKSINLGVYPFTFIVQGLYINFGLEGNFHLSDETEGFQEIMDFDGNMFSKVPIQEIDDPNFHNTFSYGLTTRLAYEIPLNNGLSVIPQAHIYYGLSKEFSTVESEKIKTRKFNFSLGVAQMF